LDGEAETKVDFLVEAPGEQAFSSYAQDLCDPCLSLARFAGYHGCKQRESQAPDFGVTYTSLVSFFVVLVDWLVVVSFGTSWYVMIFLHRIRAYRT